ncbi:MAG: hypothetical protein H5T62_03305 [Anaerolineae bacterium]|nr:hypothetical protein [Anaerolineae bacterium]
MACLDQALEGLCLFYSWSTRYQEGEVACQQAVEELVEVASGDGLLVLAKILVWQSFFATKLGHTELARQLLRQSLALLVFVKQNDTVCQPSAVPSE